MSEQTGRATKTPAMPKWEHTVRERLRTQLRRFIKPLEEMVNRDANEGDTRLLVTDILCEALGFDKYTDMSTEYRVKGEFADFALRIDQQLAAFVEVKRCTTKLNERHLRQVEMYAVNEGVEWLILTNGASWEVYRLIPGMPVTINLVLRVDLLDPEVTLTKKADALYHLTKESLKRGQIEDVWKARAATAPKALAEIVLSDSVLTEIRRELKRRSGHAISDGDLARLLRETVVREELTK